MSFYNTNKRSLYVTHYNNLNSNYNSADEENVNSQHRLINVYESPEPNAQTQTHVWIPSLDLAELTGDDGKETDSGGRNRGKNYNHHCREVGNNVCGKGAGNEKKEYGNETFFVRKQKPSFVFPNEHSLANLEIVKDKYTQNQIPTFKQTDDDTNITSVDSYRTHSNINKGMNNQQPVPLPGRRKCYNLENKISFSLKDENAAERYMRFDNGDLEYIKQHHADTDKYNNNDNDDTNPSNFEEPRINRDIEKSERQYPHHSKFTNRPSPRSKDMAKERREKQKGSTIDYEENVHTIVVPRVTEEEVVIIDGHFNTGIETNLQINNNEEETLIEAVFDENNTGLDYEQSKLEKPKQRVTFSFDENLTPNGSIKRYTPLKGNINIQIQGVLKKRPSQTQETASHSVVSKSSNDMSMNEKYMDSKEHDEHIKLSRSSYHLDPKVGNNRTAIEQGIQVKYIHTTNIDLEQKQSRMTTGNGTQHKPPVNPSSTRITLSMAAEKSIPGTGSGRRIHSKSQAYSSSAHTRSRMAYFRPSEVGSRSAGSISSAPHGRSKSSEDVRYQEQRSSHKNVIQQSENQGKLSSRSRANLPFTLRRCASSDHDLLFSNTFHSIKQKPPRPKIAFGSFILPREPTAANQVRQNQIHFQDVNRSSGNIQGGYIHTHTRRSPYAVPNQLHVKDAEKSEVLPRRQISSQQVRNFSQPLSSSPSVSAMTAKTASPHHRHSVPSSHSGHSRERSGTQPHTRLSINTSPSRTSSNVKVKSQGSSSSNAPTPNTTVAVIKTNMTTVSPNLKPTQTSSEPRSNKTSTYIMRSASGPPTPLVTNHHSVQRKHVAIDLENNRPNLATMNMMSRRDKGASHYRFVTKLQDYAKEVS